MPRQDRLPLNWRDPADYAFTEALAGAQWAWEFLRRNPEYRREWAAFWETWQALEDAYGSPPDRDFCAWKRDARAWVPAADVRGAQCRVDGHKVLIECAFGARWGFYKFPPDPGEHDPVGENRLKWREVEFRTDPLTKTDSDYLGADPAKLAVGFDLSLPLAEQLDRAKRLLQAEQRSRVRAGRVERLTVANRRAHWQLLLRLLDAEEAGAGFADIAAALGVGEIPALLEEARALSDGGYIELSRLQ